ncbi:ABC transporter ATP-binding protein [Roseibium album]|uniref:Bicarbonate transport ATP-binding protein CmpD n=1 Tax=Roseibium album TaxID=311410 RepID=A0A0M7AU42_9HYPH|nr:ATP-binding cassette domain-containing protein [Roseibium album]CTQ62342.1 Bicarbonate transport ATP-binding protein CmpD [Roseibium album]CTQ77926.1 Bicarbonate transport ATP-binding protein CmpD [Roseibium album]CTQ80107.1 Bicarbonate transport ATP-binding protein CmpD [Roseibium album]
MTEKNIQKLSVQGVAKYYDGLPVLERVNLDVEKGAFCTIVGASGCGKSTFLRMLLSQERPTRGEIFLDGIALPEEPTPDRGIVFQKYSVFPHLSVAENLILARELEEAPLTGKLFGSSRRSAFSDIGDLLEQIGLSGAANKYPAQLSGGMQQRLAIAQSLVKRPSILLLDEPFGALDPGIRLDMHELLLGLWKDLDMTIFMVTHDIHEAFKLGTRLLVFDKIRHDPQAPEAFGATITYDLPLSAPEFGAENTSPEVIAGTISREKQLPLNSSKSNLS